MWNGVVGVMAVDFVDAVKARGAMEIRVQDVEAIL
jgi:hypothetical protein